MAVINLCEQNLLALIAVAQVMMETKRLNSNAEPSSYASQELHSQQRRAELFTGGFGAFQW